MIMSKESQMIIISVFFIAIETVIANIKLYYIVYCRVFLVQLIKIRRNVYVIFFIRVT